MRILKLETKIPEYCLCRVDVSSYPGGDYRCEHPNNEDEKCYDDHEFPKDCPLDDPKQKKP